MTAYITVGFTPLNKELIQAYSAKAASTIAKFEGEFLAKAPVQSLSGARLYEYQAIIAFPTKTQAESWYNSAEYQELINLRDRGMNSSFQLIG